MSEAEFWASTPKKLYDLILIHTEVNTPKDSKKSKHKSNKEMNWLPVLD